MTQYFSNVLDKLEKKLVRIGEKADKASSERGLDVSPIRSAIDKANTAITSARSAIKTQSGKTYPIKVTAKSALKSEVGKARQVLDDDLAKVKETVKAAQSAIKDATVALTQLADKTKASPLVACDRKGKICPDGSIVGRGPHCGEFKVCPGETVQPQ